MGDKPNRKRKRFHLHLAGCLMAGLMILSCARGISSPWKPDQAALFTRHLALGECLLLKGDYEGARRESERVLAQFAGRADDRALHLLGLVQVHPNNPERNSLHAATCFRRIVDDHPESPLVMEAQTWLALIDLLEDRHQTMARMEKAASALERQLKIEKDRCLQLEERLQQMKAVDLTLE